MPYLHCQRCRLTIYQGRMFPIHAITGTCPRCAGQLGTKPASLFDASHRDRNLGLAAVRRARKRLPSAPVPPPVPGTPQAQPLREARG
jgi:hypothetical protein